MLGDLKLSATTAGAKKTGFRKVHDLSFPPECRRVTSTSFAEVVDAEKAKIAKYQELYEKTLAKKEVLA